MKKIVIVGRPNVGKSSIFNQLIRERKAITDPTPGVTRDMIMNPIVIGGRRGILVDTGGMTDDILDEFTELTVQQTQKAIDMADVLILMLEVGNLYPDDYTIIQKVRQSNKPYILVVNKADNYEREKKSLDIYELGLNDPIFVSAVHRRNLEQLTDEIFPFLDKNDQEDPYHTESMHVSIIGKPNVGKSSLLNLILGYERMLVSDKMGTTRDSVDEWIEIQQKQICLIDTAGIRRKSKVEDPLEFYSVQRAIESIDRSQIVLHLIDSIDNISNQDKKIAGIAMNNKKALILVINKWDLQENQSSKSKEDYEEWIRFRFAASSYVPVVPISCTAKIGIKALIQTMFQVWENYTRRIDTSPLNQALRLWVEKYPPPGIQRKALKLYYASQINTASPRFMFAINSLQYLTDNYQAYLINRIREDFGFQGVPITLTFKERRPSKRAKR